MQNKCITKEEWDKALEHMLLSYTIFAGVENESGLDYELINPRNIERISYNKPRPATPLKNFFLPVKEDVTGIATQEKPVIVLGAPNCDIESLGLLDEIYLQEEFNDTFYSNRRRNTVLISSDCVDPMEQCHCTSYKIHPFSTGKADLAVFLHEENMVIRILTSRGEDLMNNMIKTAISAESGLIAVVEEAQRKTEEILRKSNTDLPDSEATAALVSRAGAGIWEKYSSGCVSCGACISICPTCSCFLLIDKPGFKKVKQLDGCQYPGFERVAGGEDPLSELHVRFRNRYMCKYYWRARKFTSPACTGCGRCIDACIGKINKNKIFRELDKLKADAGR